MFGCQSKKAKVSVAAHTIEDSTSVIPGEQKNLILKCVLRGTQRKLQVQMELIGQQK